MRIISSFRRRAARATLGALVTASAPVVPLAGLSQSRPRRNQRSSTQDTARIPSARSRVLRMILLCGATLVGTASAAQASTIPTTTTTTTTTSTTSTTTSTTPPTVIFVPLSEYTSRQPAASSGILCGVQANNPHYSTNGNTILYKTTVECDQTVAITIDGSLAAGPQVGPPYPVATSHQTQTVPGNSSQVTYYTPLVGAKPVQFSSYFQGSSTASGPGFPPATFISQYVYVTFP